MRFSPVLASLLAGLVVLGAGCAPSSPTGSNSPTPATPRPAPNYEAVGLATRFYHATWNEGSVERCVYELAYPALEPSYAQAEENYERWEKVNRVIQDVAFPGIVSTTTANEYDLHASAQRYLAECRGEIEDLIKELGNEDTGHLNYVQSLGYTTQLFEAGLLSVVIQGYSYTGGAHGLPWMTGVTIGLEKGERYTLGDFVKAESLKPFMQHVRQQLLDEWDEVLFEEARTEIEGFVKDNSPITADQQETFSNLEDFYITPDGFVFYWNVYEIAPYAAGQQTVFVPFNDVRDDLIPSSPLQPLLP